MYTAEWETEASASRQGLNDVALAQYYRDHQVAGGCRFLLTSNVRLGGLLAPVEDLAREVSGRKETAADRDRLALITRAWATWRRHCEGVVVETAERRQREALTESGWTVSEATQEEATQEEATQEEATQEEAKSETEDEHTAQHRPRRKYGAQPRSGKKSVPPMPFPEGRFVVRHNGETVSGRCHTEAGAWEKARQMSGQDRLPRWAEYPEPPSLQALTDAGIWPTALPRLSVTAGRTGRQRVQPVVRVLTTRKEAEDAVTSAIFPVLMTRELLASLLAKTVQADAPIRPTRTAKIIDWQAAGRKAWETRQRRLAQAAGQ